MKKISLLLLVLVSLTGYAQKYNHKTTDPKKNNEMLIGYCNRDGFATINSNFDSCYKAEYPLYQPDKAIMDQLAKKLKGVKITLVMGSWCGDSKEWVPRFYKIMDQLPFNYRHLTLISVDRSRKAPGTPVDKLNIERVPTFIFYRKKAELGRIIEVPYGLLEEDMLKILGR